MLLPLSPSCHTITPRSTNTMCTRAHSGISNSIETNSSISRINRTQPVWKNWKEKLDGYNAQFDDSLLRSLYLCVCVCAARWEWLSQKNREKRKTENKIANAMGTGIKSKLQVFQFERKIDEWMACILQHKTLCIAKEPDSVWKNLLLRPMHIHCWHTCVPTRWCRCKNTFAATWCSLCLLIE